MQAKMLNIPSYIEDPSYRYKMPGLLLKIEGRGNGIKTKIVNLNEIATALRVPPAYALKFLGHELGSQTNEGQSVINGSFTEPEMRKHLDKFIEKYVLCSNCKYPEMVLKIKHGAVGGACNSCGTRSVLDNQHKIAAYILKNPPKDSSEFKGDKKKDGKDAKDAKDAKDPKDKKEEKESKEDKDDKKKHKDKHSHSHAHGHEQKTDDKKGENKNTEEEKDEVKGKEPVVQVVTVTFKELEEDLITKVTQVYHQYSNVETFEDKPEVVAKIIKATREIVPEEHSNKIPYILFNSIFDVNIAKQVEKNKILIEKVHEELKTRDPELDTLLNLEKFLLVRNNSFVFEKYIPTILKFFYDEDLLSEEFLIDWDDGKFNSKFIMDWRYLKGVDEKFKAASKPILKWLKDEEVEGNEGEGERKEGEEGGDDSDIDIDNI